MQSQVLLVDVKKSNSMESYKKKYIIFNLQTDKSYFSSFPSAYWSKLIILVHHYSEITEDPNSLFSSIWAQQRTKSSYNCSIPSRELSDWCQREFFEFFSLSLAIFLLLLYTPFVTFPPFLPSRVIPGKNRGESDQGDVKNGEGKTEKLKMFLIFGGLPRL